MDKKYQGRFNIQFDMREPEHLQVIEILENKRARGKASYIAAAILHYENCSETPIIRATPAMDEKMVEAVVNRILLKMPQFEHPLPSIGDTAVPPELEMRQSEAPNDASVDAAIQAIGHENLQAIMGAINAFRE